MMESLALEFVCTTPARALRILSTLSCAIHELTAKRISLGRNQETKRHPYYRSEDDNLTNSGGNPQDVPPARHAGDSPS